MKRVTVGALVDAGFAAVQTGPFGTQLKAAEYTSSGRPLLNVKNVGFGDVRLEGVEFVSDETADRLRAHALQPEDIVFGRKGAVERHALIPAALDGAVQGSDCIRLRLDRRRFVPRFASFALRTDRHQSWMRNQCSHGATMASLNQEIVRRIELPDLSLSAQHAAVAVLGSIDDLIENNRRRITLLEQMAQAIYREWFVNHRYPGYEDDELIDSPLGPVPVTWEARPFSGLAVFLNGFAFKPSHLRKSGLPIVKIKELKQGVSSATPRYHGTDIDARYRVERGDLLFSWSAHLDAYLWAWEPALLNQHVFKVTPSAGVAKSWLFLALRERMDEFRSRSQGTTMKHIKRAALGEVFVATPKPALMGAFDANVTPLIDETLALSAAQRPLDALRDLLLPKLVTGEIDISTLDLDGLLDEAAA